MTSRDQGLSSNNQERQRREPGNEVGNSSDYQNIFGLLTIRILSKLDKIFQWKYCII